MLTNDDVKKLKEVLSTKDDLNQFRTEVKYEFDQFRIEVKQSFAKVVTLEEFDQFKVEIKQDMDGLRESIQGLAVSVDKLVKAVADMHQEYVMITGKIDRHEKWFQQIAEKLGMKLEY